MPTVRPFSLLTEFDIFLFQTGKHYRLYEKMGSHLVECDGESGVYFAVWAPRARRVSVVGNFNAWKPDAHILLPRWDKSGIWEGFIPGLRKGTTYKYHITMANGKGLDKGDPYALRWEMPPRTASIVWELDYAWNDARWLEQRRQRAGQPQPWSVYEVHLGSWKKLPKEGNRSLNFRELATELVAYAQDMGFTHLELMPVMEHPYFPSWGYQITGYFAPTSRYGTPEDLMYFIDACHQANLGVILDWVPSHFPGDIHGLYLFDGSHLYEYADMRRGYHPDWNSYVFDYGRDEVRSFLISNALFWLDRYHADGLRVDAVASMLYHDYSRKEGEWIPNIHGGRENLEAISFLREFNEAAYTHYPGIETIAEESTAFPGVSKPTWEGGLGFGQKWMMGWMHDTLNYFKRPVLYRRWHQNDITFSMVYAFSERFMLPLSHDEVVHMKASLLYKMPGNEWEKFANLRALFGYQWTHPGSQLLFMGGEFGQTSEWSHDRGVVWELLQYDYHKGCQQWVRALNHLYVEKPALWYHAFSPEGYAWVSGDDTENCVLAYLRKGRPEDNVLLVVCHFKTGVVENYRLGVPYSGTWVELLNSDDPAYGGSGVTNTPIEAQPEPSHGFEHSITFRLAPLAVQIFEGKTPPKPKKTPRQKTPTAQKAQKTAKPRQPRAKTKVKTS
ncbi:MAG: 1,4-alpha-glucan branching protein GlgB [Saprospiraceae bacterium]|nr:1,4-alpha-glucan branching protein GlgB [Saprospiraceae bacterium]MDW8228365.1 1,4-alpha-glucan branching protein GlgB [Saprospiraceae bacterium]